jgi:ketol-acid reductoisomerase
MTLYYDRDADLSLLDGSTVAVIGYGSQGHAHALNLRDSGISVVVGLPPASRSRERVQADGLVVRDVAQAVQEADTIMLLAPDTCQPELYQEHIAPHLVAGSTLMFAHGFNVRFGLIEAPPAVDVSMVAPKAPGHRVREVFVEGGGTPGLVAVAQDASGRAFDRALAYARGIGCTRAGVIRTTFAEETETDLFGEQAVLCGGVSALIRNGFETLVEAGYQPEIAYFECLHELKLIVDLIYQGGLSYMWYSVSDTAEHGGYEGGDRLIDDQMRARMRALLSEVRDGSYAARWIEESRNGRKHFESRREHERNHPIEEVGQRLRAMMPFLEARGPAPGGQSLV